MSDEPHDCDFGWRLVQPGYAERLIPDVDVDRIAPEHLDAARAQIEERRAAVRESVYPCKVCNPVQFFRWAGGHFESGHDEVACADPACQRGHRSHRGGGRSLSGLEPDDRPPHPAYDPPAYIEANRADLS